MNTNEKEAGKFDRRKEATTAAVIYNNVMTQNFPNKTMHWKDLGLLSERYTDVPFTQIGNQTDHITPNQLMRMYKPVSAPEKTLELLNDCLKLNINDYERENIVRYMLVDKKNIPQDQALEARREAERKYDRFISKLQSELRRRGVPNEFSNRPYIKANLKSMQESSFLDIFVPAIIAETDRYDKSQKLDKIDSYMRRVFCRPGLNMERPKEFLLYLAMSEHQNSMSVYQIYSHLCTYYDSMKIPDEEKNYDEITYNKFMNLLNEVKYSYTEEIFKEENPDISNQLQNVLADSTGNQNKDLEGPARRFYKEIVVEYDVNIKLLFSDMISDLGKNYKIGRAHV